MPNTSPYHLSMLIEQLLLGLGYACGPINKTTASGFSNFRDTDVPGLAAHIWRHTCRLIEEDLIHVMVKTAHMRSIDERSRAVARYMPKMPETGFIAVVIDLFEYHVKRGSLALPDCRHIYTNEVTDFANGVRGFYTKENLAWYGDFANAFLAISAEHRHYDAESDRAAAIYNKLST